MGNESNQPVHKRSQRLQSVIDLVENKLKSGAKADDIDQLIEESGLQFEEKKKALNAAIALDNARKELVKTNKTNLYRIAIGSILFFIGITLSLISYNRNIIILTLFILIAILALLYTISNIKAYLTIENKIKQA